MDTAPTPLANVTQAIPFFRTRDMAAAQRFYIEGLGFRRTNCWPSPKDVQWCRLEIGEIAIMLQTFDPKSPNAPLAPFGQGVSIAFTCRDALAIWRDARAKGLEATQPFVGNGMWVTFLTDPDGYRLEFHSLTDVPEETVWSEPGG